MLGGGGGGWWDEYSCAHRAHINFGDLYLTYGCEDTPVSNSKLHSQDFIFSLMTQIVHRGQSLLNDLQKTRLSAGRMIRLLTHPLPPLSREQVVSLSQSSCVSPVELTDGGARSQSIRPREGLVLYKSFNTLCPWDSYFSLLIVRQFIVEVL